MFKVILSALLALGFSSVALAEGHDGAKHDAPKMEEKAGDHGDHKAKGKGKAKNAMKKKDATGNEPAPEAAPATAPATPPHN